MAELRFDQVNIVVPDVEGATRFLRQFGVDLPAPSAEWEDWAPHHVELPTAADRFGADLDGPAFASYWGGLPADFAGVVLNLRATTRDEVDSACQHAADLGAAVLKPPYDAFWGARYAVVRGPGPITVGFMSPAEPAARSESPHVSDFA